jgi:C1A family cysteine protease
VKRNIDIHAQDIIDSSRRQDIAHLAKYDELTRHHTDLAHSTDLIHKQSVENEKLAHKQATVSNSLANTHLLASNAQEFDRLREAAITALRTESLA